MKLMQEARAGLADSKNGTTELITLYEPLGFAFRSHTARRTCSQRKMCWPKNYRSRP